jgi:hypothetical protein
MEPLRTEIFWQHGLFLKFNGRLVLNEEKEKKGNRTGEHFFKQTLGF